MDERSQVLEQIAKERIELHRLKSIDAHKSSKIACFKRLTELYHALNLIHFKSRAA